MPREFEVIKDVATNNIWFKILTISAIALIAASWFGTRSMETLVMHHLISEIIRRFRIRKEK